MATIKDRLQKFYESQPEFKFSKKKEKFIGIQVRNKYDSRADNPPFTYRDVVDESGDSYQVRDYPESANYLIDGIIEWTYNTFVIGKQPQPQS
jgi:hypothetical protein